MIGIKPFFNVEKSRKKKKVMLYIIIALCIMMVMIGTTLALYSYLVEFGQEGQKMSLSQSPYYLDLKFFDLSTYNLDDFPIIENLLESIKVGIALVMVFGFPLVNIVVINFLLRIGSIKPLEEILKIS